MFVKHLPAPCTSLYFGSLAFRFSYVAVTFPSLSVIVVILFIVFILSVFIICFRKVIKISRNNVKFKYENNYCTKCGLNVTSAYCTRCGNKNN